MIARVHSVGDRKTLPFVLRLLRLVQQSDGKVFHGDPRLSCRVDQQSIRSKPVASSLPPSSKRFPSACSKSVFLPARACTLTVIQFLELFRPAPDCAKTIYFVPRTLKQHKRLKQAGNGLFKVRFSAFALGRAYTGHSRVYCDPIVIGPYSQVSQSPPAK